MSSASYRCTDSDCWVVDMYVPLRIDEYERFLQGLYMHVIWRVVGMDRRECLPMLCCAAILGAAALYVPVIILSVSSCQEQDLKQNELILSRAVYR